MIGCLRFCFCQTALGFLFLALVVSTSTSAADEKNPVADALPPAARRKVDYSRDIKPILIKRCYECHGPKKQEAGFRLDRKVDALAGGDSGESIIPGQSKTSSLVLYIAGVDPDIVMPPEGELLTKQQVGLIRAWIDQGAIWPTKKKDAGRSKETHWSYKTLKRPVVPNVEARTWIRNSIDTFVLKRLNAAHIEPSPSADRFTLIRRLSLDLLGLPPTPAEVDAFVNDHSPMAYEKLVDRLLNSRHFGERWGRHWLDKARYADSDGYEKDRPRPNAWKYRDWVIEAINSDYPFDLFTIDQLAGDMLPNATESQKLATAFHRQTLTNTEGGTDQEQFRVDAVFDRVETTGAVWLGLTLTCARCHSHKYDQISQREYYRIFAFFNNGDETNQNVAISQAAVEPYKVKKSEHDNSLKQLQQKIAQAKSQLGPAFAAWEKSRRNKTALWTVVEPEALEGTGGVMFTKQSDGSFLVGGKNPEKETYTMQLRSKLENITGFRLETLPDKRLPAQGPGRVKHGNFVLSQFKVAVRIGDDAESKPISFSQATANFSQKDFSVSGAIDGKKETGWAIASEFGKRHTAVFETKENIGNRNGESKVTITLDQQHGGQHTIGRFRLAVTTKKRPVQYDDLPDSIRSILALPSKKHNDKQNKELLDYYSELDPTVKKLTQQYEALKKKVPKSPYMSVRVISQRSKDPRSTHILSRGDFLQPAHQVHPDTLETLHKFQPRKGNSDADRLDLSYWLMDIENPLTPRVTINHMWIYLFGKGLVRTPSDFGVRGDKPAHPELLDWLATEYRRLGFSRKAMIKTIVMSSTYRQSSAHRPKLTTIDADNRLLHRQNRFRVEAEIVRDMSLAASGLLSRKIGGPSVFPPMPKDVAELSYANNFKWNTSKGKDRYRRGMYTFFKRTVPHPNLSAFDCPDSNLSCLSRTSSNTPLQALITLNNEVFVESSQALARRVLVSEGKTDAERMTNAFRMCLTRPPTKTEQSRLMEYLATGRDWYKDNQDDAKKLVGSYQPEGIALDQAAAWVAVSRVILNFDEFITRE